MNDIIDHAREQRQLADKRFNQLGAINIRAKSYELGKMHAYDDMIRALESSLACECKRQECRRRLELLRTLYQEVYEAGVL